MQFIVSLSQDERFAFSKDIQLDSVFASVKVKVQPQVISLLYQLVSPIPPLTKAIKEPIRGRIRKMYPVPCLKKLRDPVSYICVLGLDWN